MLAISTKSFLACLNNTISDLIKQKYQKQNVYLSEIFLKQTCLSIFISLDLSIFSSNSAYVDVICHFVAIAK